MGFRPKSKTIVVRFAEDHALYGLEAVFGGMDIRTYLRVTGMDGSEGESVGDGIERCAKALISWNVEDSEGRAVDPTPEAFMAQDHDFVLAVSGAWFEGLSGVPKSGPLDAGSASGETSPEAQIEMEILS
ncbi:hypothetical protein ACFWA4_05880 [Streptomyces sp. NPDC060011]|uniref:hypothetical protein n=1 Tax=Streptomyces sp. NPDC060011 TaxID=3347037 RepID=UPI0036C61BF1